ncbi:alanine racemase [Nocardia camponoti]|uniref:Alanine racemase n=1 Tax=Nocardia camponoti TaxID=1616106 RepID=A0A917VAX9_9NOCA|nr:alanine racemase [Nocardia camponoti]GGK56986.1 alanine racemase [Nocardia camponoti]
MSSQVETVIDLDAIAHNIGVLAAHAPGAAIMAVVKADGYNHGAVEVARAALDAGARELGVTTIAEALTLRRAGITAPVLAWLNTLDADYRAAVDADVELGVSSVAQLNAIRAAAENAGKRATVSVKVDTGLNRNGASPTEYPLLLAALREGVDNGTLRLRAIFSHLAQSDLPDDPLNDRQRARFVDAIAEAKEHGLEPELVHLANSAAALTRPDLHFDLVRPGIAVYGLSPIPDLGDFGLRPAMTFQAEVALVKKVAAGEGVSYGHRWIADRDTTLALVPAGYADGVFRSLSGRFDVSLGGALHRNVGRVCMDQFMVDLGDNPAGVRAGDTAVLFGGAGHPHALDWARTLDTIDYEVVCAPRGRTQRRHVGGNR